MGGPEIQDQKAIAREMVFQVKRQAPRIAFKAKGSIVFFDLAEIVAVKQAIQLIVSLLTDNFLRRFPNPPILNSTTHHELTYDVLRYFKISSVAKVCW